MAGQLMGGKGPRGRYRPMSEINVTPFVDVMLVLLIIVRGDRAISYGRVLEVMGIDSSAGFQRVALLAEQPTPAARPAASPAPAQPPRR